MKKNILTIAAFLFGVLSVFADNISVADVTIKPGQTVTVGISLDNTEANLVSFQMDLTLPEGITVNKAGCSLTNRFADEDQELTIGKQGDNMYRLTSTSFALTPISGTSGEIITLSLTASSTATGGTATLSNIRFVTSNSEKVTLNNTTFNIGISTTASVDDLLVCKHSYVFVADANSPVAGGVLFYKNTLFGDGYIFTPTSNAYATNQGFVDLSAADGVLVTEAIAEKYGEYGRHLNCLRLKSSQNVIAMRLTAKSKVIIFYQDHNKNDRYPVFATDAALSNRLAAGEISERCSGADGAPAANIRRIEWTAEDDGLVYIGDNGGDMYLSFIIIEAYEAPGTPSVKVGGQTYENGLWFREVTCTPVPATEEGSEEGIPTVVTYTTNGMAPTASSELYTGPIKCYEDMTVKFQAFYDFTNSGIVEEENFIDGADNEAIVSFKFDAPAITAEGGNVTITSPYEGAKNFVTLDGDKENAEEKSEFTLSESASVTAFSKIVNGTYTTFESKSTTKDVYVLDPIKEKKVITVTDGEVVVDEEATAQDPNGETIYMVKNGVISADKKDFFVKDLAYGVIKDAAYQINSKEMYIKMSTTNITFQVAEGDSVRVKVICSKNSCKYLEAEDAAEDKLDNGCTPDRQCYVNVSGTNYCLTDADGNHTNDLKLYPEANEFEFGLPAGTWTFQKYSGTGNILISSIEIAPAAESAADAPELQAPEGWTKAVSNGNLAGDNVANYVSKEAPAASGSPATIVAGAGKDGSRGIVVKSADDPAQAWDTQFWIKVDEALPAGTKLHVQFDYKANKAAKASTQAHGEPGAYQHWDCIGDVNFTTDWQTFSTDIEVSSDMATGSGGNGLLSIAFNLAEEKTATKYYFDNFGVWYQPIPVQIGNTFPASVPNDEGTVDLTFRVTSVSPLEVEVKASPEDISGAVTIPSTVEYEGLEFAVTRVSDNAFNTRNNLVSVVVPESVTIIGGSAFGWSKNLTSVTLLGDLHVIYGNAFRDCTSLENVSIKSAECIPAECFSGCTNLKSITLPEGLTTIEYNAFRNSGLESITFPSTLTEVGVAAFRDCSALNTIDFNGCTATIDAEAFIGTAIEELVIPETVILKGWTNFGWCSQLRSVEMKNINQTAHNDVFKACEKLETAILPKLAVMATGYFENCTKLQSVTFLSGTPNNYLDYAINFINVPDDVLFTIPEGTAEAYLLRGYKNLSDKGGLPMVREEFEDEASRITTMADALSDGDKASLASAISGARTIVNGTDDYMEVYAQIAAIKTAAKSFLATATLPEGFDVTAAAVTNADLDRFGIGWNVPYIGSIVGYKNPAEADHYHANGDVVMDYYIEAWRPDNALSDGNISQTITNLPAGNYRLEADMIATWQYDASVEVTGANLIAGNQSAPVATENNKPQHFSVEFTQYAEGDCKIGVDVKSTNANWVAMDNVRLYWLNGDVPAPVVDETGIYYLQNVETGKFLNQGNSWGTHAVLKDEGLPLRITRLPDGSYTFYFLEGSAREHLLFRTGPSNVYVDYNSSDANQCPYWNITATDMEGVYHIQSLITDSRYGQQVYPGTYLGNNPTKEAVNHDGTHFGVYNDVDGDITDTEGMNLKWRFVDEYDYHRLSDMTTWKGDYKERFDISNEDADNTVTFTSGAGWEHLYCPIKVETGKQYQLSVNYSGPEFLRYASNDLNIMVVDAFDYDTVTSEIGQVRVPEEGSAGEVLKFTFTAPSDELFVFLNFGCVEDGYTHEFHFDRWKLIEVQDNMLYSDETLTVLPEGMATLKLNLKNEAAVNMIDFYLQLPEGMSIADGSDGNPDVSLVSGRSNKHVVTAQLKEAGRYHIVCYSSQNNAFNDNDGALFNITLACDEDVAVGNYEGTVMNILMSDTDRNSLVQPNFTFNIEVPDLQLGDVNNDGNINGLDIVEMVDHIMHRPSENFHFATADLHCDNKINGLDLVKLVKLVLDQDITPNASHAPAMRRNAPREGWLTLKDNGRGSLTMGVDSSDGFLLAQCVVEVSEGMQLKNITADGSHVVAWQPIDERRYAVVAYSAKNDVFGTNGSLLTFDCSGKGTLMVSSVMLVDNERNERHFASTGLDVVTGLDAVEMEGKADAYDLQGRKMVDDRLPKGVYIINGKKVVVR